MTISRRGATRNLFFVLALTLLIGCSSRSDQSPVEGPDGGDSRHQGATTMPLPPTDPGWEPLRTVEGEPLDEQEIAALLSRLPELEAQRGDQVSFKRRESSMPPPLTGDDIQGDWPPDLSQPTASTTTDKSLKVQAFRPTGEVRPPFQVAIAFDRPVVAIGAVLERPIPELSLQPEIEGRWRWLGTQTLVFEPAAHWPGSTEFSVELSPGLEAVDGSTLEEEVRFEFTTPAARVQAVYPPSYRPQAADAAVVVVFNQKIDPQTAENIVVSVGRSTHPMRLVDGEAHSEAVADVYAQGADEEGRVLVLAPQENYPDDATVNVAVEGPIVSAEGPVLGTEKHAHTFKVRGPFELKSLDCGYGDCRPTSSLRLHFTNPIGTADGPPEITLDPAVENLSVQVYSNVIHLSGDFQAYTTYEATVQSDLIDTFDQTIQGSRSKSIAIEGFAPFVAGPSQPVVVRPRSAPPTLPIMLAEISKLRVRLFNVTPEDWESFQNFQSRRSDDLWLDPVQEQTLRFSRDERRQRQQVDLDLSPAFEDSPTGHVMVLLDEARPRQGHLRRNYEPRWVYWVQRSDLAADITSDMQEIVAQITSLQNGDPVASAQLSLAHHATASTDSKGMASLELQANQNRQNPLIITHGDDSLLIPVNGQVGWMYPGQQWTYRAAQQNALWYVVDDRQMYKPEESVHLRGWIRAQESSPHAGLASLTRDSTLTYTVRGPMNNEIATGELSLDRFGGFSLEFDIPAAVNLGHASVRFNLRGALNATHYHSVQIQEFRRPEYEVNLSSSGGPHLVGEETYFEVEASYYAGGALAGAPSSWQFTESRASFKPSGWSSWSFGAWSPWWWHFPGGHHQIEEATQVLPDTARGVTEVNTDSSGRAAMAMTFQAPDAGFARSVTANVSVTDVNRQSWQASESILVHPAANYIGLRAEKTFIQRDEAWEVETAVVDIDGNHVEDRPVIVEITRWRSGESEVVKSCSHTSTDTSITCSFEGLAPGSYQAVATVEDARGRSSQSHLVFWVAGQDRSGAETAEEDRILLIPETDTFQVGDTARLFVQAPYYPLDAVVELRRDGRFERRLITITEEDPTLTVEITEAMLPNVHVFVNAVAAGESYAADAFAAGSINLKVDPGPRRLAVEISPGSRAIAPGATLDVAVEVNDDNGAPVHNAQVLLFAVDEALLALSDYQLSDPLSIFYPERAPQVFDIRSRAWLLLEADEAAQDEAALDGSAEQHPIMESDMAPLRMMARSAAPAAKGDLGGFGSVGGLGSASPQPPPINVREVFDALAFFETDLITDENGRASLTATMPESLTRYRIMAVAVEGHDRFGHGEDEVTARMPLMVRPAEPRFLNVGDEFDFSVVVQNQTLEPMTVDLALRAASNLEWMQAPGRRVEVPAADRVEVRFRARATSAGDARVQIAGASGVHADAALATFPILTPATTEAFATYGSLVEEDAILQALQIPRDAYSEFGGLNFSASSTQLQALTDAFIYLIDYHFDFAEHLASRILSVQALYDVLDAFDVPELPEPAEMDAAVDGWIKRLVAMQHPDGGFGFWEGAPRSFPFTSVHASFALYQAKQAGRDVPEHVLSRAVAYLTNISRQLADYQPRATATVEAYALYVRHRMSASFDEISPADLDALLSRHGIENLSLEALGWLLPLAENTRWEERFLQRITGQVQETAATAEFQETYPAQSYRILHTTRRTDGVVLDGLMQVDPQHRLVEKVVHGLLAHRQRGRWANTQENVFILMALRRYFDEYEDTEPDFIARAWLGDEQIAEHEFKGRTTDRYHVDVPMAFLQEGDDTQPVVVQRDGEGRMYYRLGIDYAPRSRQLPPLNEGFQVERAYHAVDDDDDVTRDEEGNWVIKAGARVQVTLTMAIPARRYHVALVDWLPAGFEPINTALAVSSLEEGLAGASSDRRSWWGWWGWPWFDHQNMRDERVEAFASLVSEGVYTYSYVARATTVGTFIAMPAKAEELYHPETFGRSATELVHVVDARP